LIIPGTVLCLGPGNHCHLEMTAGPDCNADLAGSQAPAHRPRDGCPKGSRDFQLRVDCHRGDIMRIVGVTVAALFTVPVPIGISLPPRPAAPGYSIARELNSTSVIRC
jgi:hypothetical protein